MSIAGLTECNLSNHDFKYAQSAVSSLAPFYGAGILTFVTVPETESERDFLRSRQFVLHQLSELVAKMLDEYAMNFFKKMEGRI